MLTCRRRLSLVGPTATNRKGSSSKGLHAAVPGSPVTTLEQKLPRQSKLLKAMDLSAVKEHGQSSVQIDENTVYLEDLEVGVRGLVLLIIDFHIDTYFL